jgi:L-arabinose isomerase
MTHVEGNHVHGTDETVEDFAVIAGVELVRIGDSTTTESFRRELRGNLAYCRLAQDLACWPGTRCARIR